MPIKSTTMDGEGKMWGKGKNRKKKKEKRKKIQKNLQNKSKHKNNKCFSWVTAVRDLSLTGSHSPSHFPRAPSNAVLVSGPAVREAQILMWSCSRVFLPPVPTAVRASAFSLWELSYIFHGHSLPSWSCGFNLQLVHWWEDFGSSSLAMLPLGFNCGLISTSACGSSTGVCSWGCPGGLAFAPVRARCGGGTAAWVTGFWQHQVFQGVGG